MIFFFSIYCESGALELGSRDRVNETDQDPTVHWCRCLPPTSQGEERLSVGKSLNVRPSNREPPSTPIFLLPVPSRPRGKDEPPPVGGLQPLLLHSGSCPLLLLPDYLPSLIWFLLLTLLLLYCFLPVTEQRNGAVKVVHLGCRQEGYDVRSIKKQ